MIYEIVKEADERMAVLLDVPEDRESEANSPLSAIRSKWNPSPLSSKPGKFK